jgi:hypothetical protein
MEAIVAIGSLGAATALAAPPASDSLASETLPWLGVFAAVAIVAWLVAHWLRRALRRERKGPLGGFDTADLERMRRDGELTDEQVRAIMRASALSAARDAGPETPDSGPGTDRGPARGGNGPRPS